MIEINLLPKEYRKRGSIFSFDKKLIYIGVGCGAVVLVLIALTLYQQYESGRLNGLIARAKVEETRYQKDIAIIDALTEVKGKILERLEAIDRLDRRRTFYISMLEDLNYRVPEFLWMTTFTESPLSAIAPPGQAPATPASAGKQTANPAEAQQAAGPQIGSVVVEGYAYNLSAIGSFMVGLMKSDYFDNVKLSRAILEDVAQIKAYNFKISCDLNYDASGTPDEFEDLPDQGFDLSSSMEDEAWEMEY